MGKIEEIQDEINNAEELITKLDGEIFRTSDSTTLTALVNNKAETFFRIRRLKAKIAQLQGNGKYYLIIVEVTKDKEISYGFYLTFYVDGILSTPNYFLIYERIRRDYAEADEFKPEISEIPESTFKQFKDIFPAIGL